MILVMFYISTTARSKGVIMEHALIMLRHELKDIAEASQEEETKEKLYKLINIVVDTQEEFF